MNKVLAFFIVMVISIPCFAVESMSNKGKPGVWMSEEEFNVALAERKELKILKDELVPALKLDIEKYKVLVSQKDLEIQTINDIMAKKDELYLASVKLKEAEVSKLELKIEKLEKWYRSPSVYLISGVLLGGLVAVGLEFGIDEAKK
jgi:maltose-binding protein MalE